MCGRDDGAAEHVNPASTEHVVVKRRDTACAQVVWGRARCVGHLQRAIELGREPR